MDVMFTIKTETPAEWKNYKEEVWFYLEDVPIFQTDFAIQHSDTGFTVKMHEWTALRARDALKAFCMSKPVTIITELLLGNSEIMPVKKKKIQENKSDKISNVKYKTREDVALRKPK